MDEHLRVNASIPDGKNNYAQEVLTKQHARQSSRDFLSPQNPRGEVIPPVSLVVILALFLFLCVGVDVGFGAWVALVVMRDGLAGETGAARIARCELKQEMHSYK